MTSRGTSPLRRHGPCPDLSERGRDHPASGEKPSTAHEAFLRSILEEDVGVGLTPLVEHGRWEFNRVSGAGEGAYRLLYFGEHQPAHWAVGLPMVDGDDAIDLIDTWEMTVTPIEKAPLPASPALRQRGGAIVGGAPEAAFGVYPPGKPFQALRIRQGRS